MGKVLSLVTTSKGPVSDDLLASIEFSALPHVALIGAMEVLKNDYLNELYGEKTDE